MDSSQQVRVCGFFSTSEGVWTDSSQQVSGSLELINVVN